MARPSSISVPPVPSDANPLAFLDDAEGILNAFDDFVAYVDSIVGFSDTSTAAAVAARLVQGMSSSELSSLAGKIIGRNAAGTAFQGVNRTTASFASNAEALAGTVADKLMSPLRVKSKIDSLFSPPLWKKIVSRSAAGQSEVVFNATDFGTTRKNYLFFFKGILPPTSSLAAGIRIAVSASDDGGHTFTVENQFISGGISRQWYSPGAWGVAAVYGLREDKGAICRSRLVSHSYGSSGNYAHRYALRLQLPSVDAPVNWVRFTFPDVHNTSLMTTVVGGEIILFGAD